MDHHELHTHITAAASATRQGLLRGLTSRLVAYCWPGGQHDRYNTAAVAWVREWGPLRTGVAVPVCSCASGHCDVCN
ncbi:MAG: hypothetical protein ACXVSE_14885 [Solirubrobacteraceae bacterium]